MPTSLLLCFLAFSVVTFSQKECKWASQGRSLDLRTLTGLTLISTNNPNSPSGWIYLYTPCQNNILSCGMYVTINII